MKCTKIHYTCHKYSHSRHVQFDPMCIIENPTEDDNRPFQYTRTSNEINMVLDQQEVENSNSRNINTNKSTNL